VGDHRAIAVPPGGKFPVLLRSYERIRQRRWWRQCCHQWRLALQQSSAAVRAARYLAPDDPASARDVDEALSPDHKLAFVLGRPPAEQAGLTINDPYAGALQAGAAYLFWIREVSLAEDVRAAIDAALADTPVRDLPARIVEWRSPRDRSGLGRHISVVARDYDRRNPFAGRELGPSSSEAAPCCSRAQWLGGSNSAGPAASAGPRRSFRHAPTARCCSRCMPADRRRCRRY
jgi:hypothetical protein